MARRYAFTHSSFGFGPYILPRSLDSFAINQPDRPYLERREEQKKYRNRQKRDAVERYGEKQNELHGCPARTIDEPRPPDVLVDQPCDGSKPGCDE